MHHAICSPALWFRVVIVAIIFYRIFFPPVCLVVTFVNLSAHTSYKQIFVVVQESRVMVKQLLFRTTLCYINHTRHVGFVQWAILNLLPNATVEPPVSL